MLQLKVMKFQNSPILCVKKVPFHKSGYTFSHEIEKVQQKGN